MEVPDQKSKRGVFYVYWSLYQVGQLVGLRGFGTINLEDGKKHFIWMKEHRNFGSGGSEIRDLGWSASWGSILGSEGRFRRSRGSIWRVQGVDQPEGSKIRGSASPEGPKSRI